MDVAETDFTGEIAALLKGFFSFTWEAYDNVGGEVEVGTECLDSLAHLTELVDGVEAVHPFQGVVGAALETDVHVWGEFLMLEQGQKSVAELVRLDGGDSDTEVAFNF